MSEPIGEINNYEINEGLLHDLITNRTWADVINNTLIGQLNPSDLNRVEMYCRQLCNELKDAGYNIDIKINETKHDWNFADLRKTTELERIRQNILKLMRGYHYITKIYSSVEGFNYNYINNWETILNEIKGMLFGMNNYYSYSGVVNSGQNKVWGNRFRHLELNRNQRAYNRLDYIESIGDQYLDTLLTIDNNLQIEVDFQLVEMPTAGLYLFGASDTRGRYYFGATDSGKWWCACKSGEWYSFGESDLEKHNIIYNNSNKKVLLDGVEVATTKTFYSFQDCFLMSSQTGGGTALNTGGNKFRIYKAILSDRTTGVIYRNLIPIKDGNGVVCMHDTITGLNIYNKGQGDFIGGNVINEINYLQSQGKQYITAGNLTQNGIRVRMEVEMPIVPTANVYIMGNNSSSYYRLGFKIDASKRFGYVYTNGNSFTMVNTSSNFWQTNVKYVLDGYWAESEHWFKVNDVAPFSITATSPDKSVGPLRVFSYGISANSVIKIYSFMVWQNGELVRDMIPVQDADKKPCLFDRVTHTYYYNNSNRGSFIFG